jgi:hypothetical protein
MFFAYGFEYAKECGAKMVTTFKLCSEQLSAQPHYDYGELLSEELSSPVLKFPFSVTPFLFALLLP